MNDPNKVKVSNLLKKKTTLN